jgi:nucleotide sugar dehydrogenase
VKVGYVGCGKLAFPIALAVENKGYEVLVHDPSPLVNEILGSKKYPHKEAGVDELLQYTNIKNVDLNTLCGWADIIFVAVQTPHNPKYEGITRLSQDRVDFDYSYLEQAVSQVSKAIQETRDSDSYPSVVVISTVLPGTMRNRIIPILPKGIDFTYSPAFPAMGTVIKDFLHPEFVLLGSDVELTEGHPVIDFYEGLFYDSTPPFLQMPIESAEMAKVAYNTFISTKIATINALMELCHKIPNCNIDDISLVLENATKRISASAYLRGGCGDSGPCFTGDTKISLLNGKEVPIKDLVGLPEFYVYSYDINRQEVTVGRGHSCRKTVENSRLIEVVLDNGEKIRCTRNHPFLLKNGRYVEAKDLNENDSLMALYRRLDNKGYEESLHSVQNKWEHTHRIVYKWKYGGMLTLKVAHHKDFNKRNNDPSNFIAMQWHQHWKYHSSKAKKMIRKLLDEGKINSPKHREVTTMRNFKDNPVWKPGVVDKISKKVKETNIKQREAGTYHMINNNPTPKLMAEGRHNFQVCHPMHDKKKKEGMIVKLNEYYSKRAGFDSYEHSAKCVWKLYDQGLSVRQIAKELGVRGRFVGYRIDQGRNHKVVSVTSILQKEDVYDFEVDIHHNFALSSGVFVHNCHPRDNIAMSWLGNKIGLRHDPFDTSMKAREDQTEWLADLVQEESEKQNLPIYIFGKGYKANSAIITGSAALLLTSFLKEQDVKFVHWDPLVDVETDQPYEKGVYFVATNHSQFKNLKVPEGSVVIDPWRFVDEQEGVQLVKVGVGPSLPKEVF